MTIDLSYCEFDGNSFETMVGEKDVKLYLLDEEPLSEAQETSIQAILITVDGKKISNIIGLYEIATNRKELIGKKLSRDNFSYCSLEFPDDN